MAIALELNEERAFQLEAVPRTAGARRFWIPIPLALFVVFVVMLVFMVGSELRANSQFGRAHDSLIQADGRMAAAEAQLTMVHDNLRFLRVQITASQKALSADATLLGGVRAALAQAQSDVTEKSGYIVNLKTCQGGIQQALNALSVGDENHAVAALNGVSSACQSVAASSG